MTMRSHVVTRALASGLLVVAAAACSETKTTVQYADLKIDVTACLGTADGKVQGPDGEVATTCRARLDEVVPDLPVNACLILQEIGQDSAQHAVALRWKDGTLTPVDEAPEIPVPTGREVKAELFFVGEGFTAELCGGDDGLQFGDPCEARRNFCVVKLIEADIRVTGGEETIDFRPSQGACQTEWREELSQGNERCDGADDDCDGLVDDGVVDSGGRPLGAECNVGVGACAQSGRLECGMDGSVVCSATAGAPVAETCNGIDDDCDGMADNGVVDCCRAGSQTSCGVTRGICLAGTSPCIVEAGETFGRPDPNVCVDGSGSQVVLPTTEAERCNGQDDDCDGNIDEGFRAAMPCEIAMGGCRSSGMEVCTPDGNGTMCQAPPVQGFVEVCNGLDDDCDGTADNGFDLGGLCATPDEVLGACRRDGVLACAPDGMGTFCAAAGGEPLTPGAPERERCGDAIDGDCDGATDNGFENLLGQPCSVGQGLCTRSGEIVCDAVDSTRTICNAEAAMAVPEVCDLDDNDCDGSADEDFDLQTSTTHCGVCNNECVLTQAVATCTQGECRILACLGTYENHDGIDENGCECNAGDDDTPDPDFLDSNCDDVDGDRNASVFVSAALGRDPDDPNPALRGTGAIDRPFRRIQDGVLAAELSGHPILLDAGRYDLEGETLVVPSGVSIHGGYRYNDATGVWARASREVNASVLFGATIALRYQDLDASTTLDNVVVEASDAVVSQTSSIGVHAIRVGDFLTIRDARIVAGNGAPGNDGQPGDAAAANAQPGGPGAGSNAGQPGIGGLAGANQVCANGTAGGAGGNAAFSSAGNAMAAAGTAGQTPPGAMLSGPGGPAGPLQTDGGPGTNGGTGAHGANTPGGSPEGVVNDQMGGAPLVWIPRPSQTAPNGANGGGGGGGGGGGAANAGGGPGGGGGGGGAGGCGGEGGNAAQGGGGSFGVLLVGGHLTLVEVIVQSSVGGEGGAGGNGGAAGVGASGGAGGSRSGTAGRGGNGGNGGNGGCGGHAGGAAGGPSFAVLRVAPPRVMGGEAPRVDVETSITFRDYAGDVVDAAAARNASFFVGGPGDGGGGGNRNGCGAAAQNGTEGYEGPVGCCRASGSPPTACGNLTVCE
ncbi:MAG: MopE-related protein [Bradymonadia bacterium]